MRSPVQVMGMSPWYKRLEEVWVIWCVRMTRNLDGTTVGYSEPAAHEDGCYILFNTEKEAHTYRDKHHPTGGVGQIRTQDLAVSRIKPDEQHLIVLGISTS